MSAVELFVLADDISFIPVNEIHEKTKSSFDHDHHDVVITHMHTRKSSKVLHRDAAALLKEFEIPKSWAEAIVHFSSANKKDPQHLADEAVELLLEMKEQGFLIPYKQGEQPRTDGLFKINDRFKKYIIKERVQFLEDSEVYCAQDERGNKYALKILKSENDANISFVFRNEMEILRNLDGKVNPSLIDQGVEPGFAYLIIEWCEGVTCETKAASLRNLTIRSNTIAMLDLCISIVNAYNHLHKQGVLHSDIYPKNILVSESGICKIIDYGISMTIENHKLMPRGGGVCYYFEPEYAEAVIKEKNCPHPTEKSEQYSIAAVLYFLITGRHYLNFSIEREKLFAQIVNDAPISFNNYDLNLPGELDNIFAIALAKHPEKRFNTLRDFAKAITEVRNSIYSSADFFISGKGNSVSQFVDFIIRKFGWNSSFLRKGLSLAPACSVNYGEAGIAYMFYRIACVREEAKLLDIADLWANRAANYVSDYDRAFYCAEMELTKESIGQRSMYHSPTGVHLVQAIISQCRGDHRSMEHSVKKFLTEAQKSCDKIDVTLGKSGLLIGCSILFNELEGFDRKPIIIFANNVVEELWKQLDGYADMNLPNLVDYFGIAHGWAGLMYATLLWCRASKTNLPVNFLKRVEELQNSSAVENDICRWKVSTSDNNFLTGWCNGSAGYIFLWSLLYRQFKEEKYLSVAMQVANHITLNSKDNISNLCCGYAGEAYALLNLYNLIKEKKYLDESHKITQKILNQISLVPLRSNSLYKGDIGLALLFCEMEKPEMARMPLFETGTV